MTREPLGSCGALILDVRSAPEKQPSSFEQWFAIIGQRTSNHENNKLNRYSNRQRWSRLWRHGASEGKRTRRADYKQLRRACRGAASCAGRSKRRNNCSLGKRGRQL